MSNGERPLGYQPESYEPSPKPPILDSNSMFCRHCGTVIDKDCIICTACGKQVGVLTQTKYCKFCGSIIDVECVVCPKCGKQIEELKTAAPHAGVANPGVVITNNNIAGAYGAYPMGVPKDKWIALVLCLFLGYLGAHKFYEGKIGVGILYILTVGLFGIGIIVDFIVLLFRPNPYYINHR